MALSSSCRRAARAPPRPAQVAAFYKLVDKKEIAGLLSRHARDAELSAQAAVQAEALFGDDSLVVAHLRYCESESLAALYVGTNGAEADAPVRRSWDVLVSSVIPLLLRRLEADTLLPGALREEELDYDIRVQAVAAKTQNEPVPSRALLQAWASTMKYTTLMLAMSRGLSSLSLHLWSQHERKLVESFVLQGLDVIPRTAGIPTDMIGGEDRVAMVIERDMSPRFYGPAFCAAVLRKWRSTAVSSVLRARGALQTRITTFEQILAEFDAKKLADTVKHGLRECALPSCSKTEKTVKEFAGCTGCRSVVYCCPEHQALDWRAHKKAFREKEAVRLATEEAVAEEGHATEEEVAFNLKLG